MNIKDLPNLNEPKFYQLDLDDIQDFISIYRDLIKDNRFTILCADGNGKTAFIAYYEKDGKEYGYGIRIGWGKSWKFITEENRGLEGDNKYWNIHHYMGTDNPIQRILDQRVKEVDIAIGKITDLRERYPELKTNINDRLLKIIYDKTTEDNK